MKTYKGLAHLVGLAALVTGCAGFEMKNGYPSRPFGPTNLSQRAFITLTKAPTWQAPWVLNHREGDLIFVVRAEDGFSRLGSNLSLSVTSTKTGYSILYIDQFILLGFSEKRGYFIDPPGLDAVARCELKSGDCQLLPLTPEREEEFNHYLHKLFPDLE